jgi:hypothetical protein
MMKTNSSSSSFVILGVSEEHFNGLSEDIKERILEGDMEDEYIYDEEEGVCGYRLGRIGEGSSTSVTLTEINDLVSTVSDDLGVPDSALKVIAWEMYQ